MLAFNGWSTRSPPALELGVDRVSTTGLWLESRFVSVRKMRKNFKAASIQSCPILVRFRLLVADSLTFTQRPITRMATSG